MLAWKRRDETQKDKGLHKADIFFPPGPKVSSSSNYNSRPPHLCHIGCKSCMPVEIIFLEIEPKLHDQSQPPTTSTPPDPSPFLLVENPLRPFPRKSIQPPLHRTTREPSKESSESTSKTTILMPSYLSSLTSPTHLCRFHHLLTAPAILVSRLGSAKFAGRLVYQQESVPSAALIHDNHHKKKFLRWLFQIHSRNELGHRRLGPASWSLVLPVADHPGIYGQR